MRPERIDCFRGKYDFLSNFYPAEIEFEGVRCASAEAAFQAQKTGDAGERAAISRLAPDAAKRAGGRLPLPPNWEEIRIERMRGVVRAKFEQHPDLAARLLDTGDAQLFEGNARGDLFWGVDARTGEGQNHMGRILMEVRADLAARFGQARRAQKCARGEDWAYRPMAENPQRFTGLNARLTREEYALARRGLVPGGMEDKWFVFCEGEAMRFCLGWTGECVYMLEARPEDKNVVFDEVLSTMHADEPADTLEKRQRNQKMDRLLLRVLLYALAGNGKKARHSLRALHEMYHLPYRYGDKTMLTRLMLGAAICDML